MARKFVSLHLEVGVVCYLLGGMSRRFVRDRIKAGDLEGYLLGNKMVVSADSVNAYLQNQRISPEDSANQPPPSVEKERS